MRSPHIFETLSQSNAQLLGQTNVRRGISVAHWANDYDRVDYQKDHQHTLSCYLVGGEGSHRVDGKFKRSRPSGSKGAVTLMPQGSTSSWEIQRPFQFGHLYFQDEAIRTFAEQTHDIDPRRIALSDLTFVEDPALSQQCLDLFALPLDASPLAYEQHIESIFALLVEQALQRVQPDYSGGLSPWAKHRIREYIEAYWQSHLSLADLADQVSLSPFHFQKAFKASFGCSPADFQTNLRIQHAKTLLTNAHSLGWISDTCGFANSGHFSRTFKQWVGVTPSAYRRQNLNA